LDLIRQRDRERYERDKDKRIELVVEAGIGGGRACATHQMTVALPTPRCANATATYAPTASD
jgi:hypothetical protein